MVMLLLRTYRSGIPLPAVTHHDETVRRLAHQAQRLESGSISAVYSHHGGEPDT